MCSKLQGGELHGAQEVRHLEEDVLLGSGGLIHHGLLGELAIEGIVQGTSHHILAAIVIYLHLIEVLEERQVLLQEDRQILLEPRGELLRLGNLTPPVREDLEPVRKGLLQDEEAHEQPLSVLEGHTSVVALTVHQRRRVEGDILKRGITQRATVPDQGIVEALTLLVKHQGDDTVAGVAVLATALVAEHRHFSHRNLRKKMPGDNSRRLGRSKSLR